MDKLEIGVFNNNYYREHKAEFEEIAKGLKPCPLCGGTDIEFSLIHPQYYGRPDMTYWCYWEISCPDCGINIDNGVVDNEKATDDDWERAKEEIIERWNTRIEV